MSKKSKVEAGEPVDGAALLGPHQEALGKIADELSKLSEAAAQEVLKIQLKYKGLARPIYQKRAAVFKRIPHIWLQIVNLDAIAHSQLSNSMQLADVITEKDAEVLKALQDLDVEEDENGYKILMVRDIYLLLIP